jgi:hypothetical protein
MSDPRIEAAIKFHHLCTEAESENRAQGLEALQFRWGDQWPVQIQNSRTLEARPFLTINKVDTFCRQIENQQRQQRPRIKVDPVNGEADKKIADVIKGMIRHIEVSRGGADLAYDTGFSSAVTCGFGYWRVLTDYVSDSSFDQEIYLAPIDNPFTVYFDPNSTMPDGSDSKACLISTLMRKKDFEAQYPKADTQGFTEKSLGDHTAEWITKEDIRVAEYFYITNKPEKLHKLSNGMSVWDSELPEGALEEHQLQIVDTRKSNRPTVKWCKITCNNVLEERDIPGRYIPVVPMYGNVTVIDGKRKRSGVVKNAMDPQRMVNFHETTATESVALAPKAKWVMAEGQDEGHENEWAQANVSARPILHYKQTDVDGREAPAPQRQQPELPPSGTLELLQQSSQNLREVIGVIDPAQRLAGNVSGKALQGEQKQSDNSNFHFYDNLTRSIRHTGKIILEWIPHYYDQERVVRIIGDDGRAETATINQQAPDPAINAVLNDVTVGEYDIVMDIGPGYNSKRQEAVDMMMPLISQHEDLFKAIGDLVFRNMDFPGAEMIADRLAAANPLAQIDEKSDIPPQIQMKLKQQDQQIQQLNQQLQAAGMEIKTRQSIKQMEEDGETKREMLRQTTKAHDIESRNQTLIKVEQMENEAWMHDVQMKVSSAQNVAEIKATVELLLHHLSAKQENLMGLNSDKKDDHDLSAVIGRHPIHGNITEADILKTAHHNNMTPQKVMERLQNG